MLPFHFVRMRRSALTLPGGGDPARSLREMSRRAGTFTLRQYRCGGSLPLSVQFRDAHLACGTLTPRLAGLSMQPALSAPHTLTRAAMARPMPATLTNMPTDHA